MLYRARRTRLINFQQVKRLFAELIIVVDMGFEPGTKKSGNQGIADTLIVQLSKLSWVRFDTSFRWPPMPLGQDDALLD